MSQCNEAMHCERCKRFIGEDCSEGVDWSAGMQMDGDVAWTGLYYCAPGVGCNSDEAIASALPGTRAGEKS
jgi:hypothetical protein